MGKIIKFPRKATHKQRQMLPPGLTRELFVYVPCVVPEVSLVRVCGDFDPPDSESGWVAYQIMYSGSAHVLCQMMREACGIAHRVATETGQFVVVVPPDYPIHAGMSLNVEGQTGSIISAHALGPFS